MNKITTNMLGRQYDFIMKDGKLQFRETNSGQIWAPISDSPRYNPKVRKVVREVTKQLNG